MTAMVINTIKEKQGKIPHFIQIHQVVRAIVFAADRQVHKDSFYNVCSLSAKK
jgi:nucleoside-diphosphate-sugar epimerase